MSAIALIVSIVRKGWSDTVLAAAVEAGAHGGTVLAGRGTGIHEQQASPDIAIEPEKEIVLTLTYAHQAEGILQEIVRAADLETPGNGLAFVVPIDRVVGTPHIGGGAPAP
jgi:nitrogen regulatory protein PII